MKSIHFLNKFFGRFLIKNDQNDISTQSRQVRFLQQFHNIINMCQFIPFNPFSIYEDPKQQQQFKELPSSLKTQQSLSAQMEDEYRSEESFSETRTTSTKMKQKSSKFHNMTKQTVITMKQIMNNHISEIGSTSFKRAIIRQFWERLTKKSHPTKQTLKAMFDLDVNIKLLKKEGLVETENQFNSKDIKEAMEELKCEILMRLKESNIRSNLIKREITNKEVLLAYIQHFLHYELETGDIKARFGVNGAIKIDKIVNKSRIEEDFISDLLI